MVTRCYRIVFPQSFYHGLGLNRPSRAPASTQMKSKSTACHHPKGKPQTCMKSQVYSAVRAWLGYKLTKGSRAFFYSTVSALTTSQSHSRAGSRIIKIALASQRGIIDRGWTNNDSNFPFCFDFLSKTSLSPHHRTFHSTSTHY